MHENNNGKIISTKNYCHSNCIECIKQHLVIKNILNNYFKLIIIYNTRKHVILNIIEYLINFFIIN